MIETVYRVRCSGPCRRYLTPDGPQKGDWPEIYQFESVVKGHEAARQARWLRHDSPGLVMCPRCQHAADLRAAVMADRRWVAARIRELNAADPELMARMKAGVSRANPELPQAKRIEQALGQTLQSHEVIRVLIKIGAADLFEVIAAKAESGDPEYPDDFIAETAYEARWALHEMEQGRPFGSWPPDEEWAQRDKHR